MNTATLAIDLTANKRFDGGIAKVQASMSRNALIVIAASTMALGGSDLHTFFTQNLLQEINYMVTGENESPTTAIDKNLVLTQVVMSAIDNAQGLNGCTSGSNVTSVGVSSLVGALARAKDNTSYLLVQFGERPEGCKFCEWVHVYTQQGRVLTRSQPPILRDDMQPDQSALMPNNSEFDALSKKLDLERVSHSQANHPADAHEYLRHQPSIQ